MSFHFETKTQRVYVTQTGHQHSAKLSHFVGGVPDLGSFPLSLHDFTLLVCWKLNLAPESLWVLSAS